MISGSRDNPPFSRFTLAELTFRFFFFFLKNQTNLLYENDELVSRGETTGKGKHEVSPREIA